MIVTGNNITTKDDPLVKIKVEYLYHKIKQPNAEIESKIRQLRVVKQLDPKQYSLLKKQLPYIVCGVFNPLVRRTEYFGYTEYFMLDIDKIEEKELSISGLREQFNGDSRVLMCFLSPGKDGLKIMFKLKERCYDATVYSIFYKSFLIQFATQYGLQQVIDTRTSDVARACFVSMDEEAYYNPAADVVDMNLFINTDDTSELFRQQREINRNMPVASVSAEIDEKRVIDDDALVKIKALLHPDMRQPSTKHEAYVPKELDELMERLVPYIEQTGVSVKKVDGISYGKKIQLLLGVKLAEINIFYGKKGYSVVISPRKGTDNELNELMSELINQFMVMCC